MLENVYPRFCMIFFFYGTLFYGTIQIVPHCEVDDSKEQFTCQKKNNVIEGATLSLAQFPAHNNR